MRWSLLSGPQEVREEGARGGFGSLFLVKERNRRVWARTLTPLSTSCEAALCEARSPLRGRRDLSALHRAQIR